MVVTHTVDKEQVNMVLHEFEETLQAIKGIEQKCSQVYTYVQAMQEQRLASEAKLQAAAEFVDNFSGQIEEQSDEVLEYCINALETFAGVAEQLESTVSRIRLQDFPRQLQREIAPMLVPAFVLVLIVTVSNCYFGFLLADDAVLSEGLFVAIAGPGRLEQVRAFNILRVFAIFHVSLISAAIFYVLLEVMPFPGRGKEGRRSQAKHAEEADASPSGSTEGEDAIGDTNFERGVSGASSSPSTGMGAEDSGKRRPIKPSKVLRRIASAQQDLISKSENEAHALSLPRLKKGTSSELLKEQEAKDTQHVSASRGVRSISSIAEDEEKEVFPPKPAGFPSLLHEDLVKYENEEGEEKTIDMGDAKAEDISSAWSC